MKFSAILLVLPVLALAQTCPYSAARCLMPDPDSDYDIEKTNQVTEDICNMIEKNICECARGTACVARDSFGDFAEECSNQGGWDSFGC